MFFDEGVGDGGRAVGFDVVVGDPFPGISGEVVEADGIGSATDGFADMVGGYGESILVPVGVGYIVTIVNGVGEVLPSFGGVLPLGFCGEAAIVVVCECPGSPPADEGDRPIGNTSLSRQIGGGGGVGLSPVFKFAGEILAGAAPVVEVVFDAIDISAFGCSVILVITEVVPVKIVHIVRVFDIELIGRRIETDVGDIEGVFGFDVSGEGVVVASSVAIVVVIVVFHDTGTFKAVEGLAIIGGGAGALDELLVFVGACCAGNNLDQAILKSCIKEFYVLGVGDLSFADGIITDGDLVFRGGGFLVRIANEAIVTRGEGAATDVFHDDGGGQGLGSKLCEHKKWNKELHG